MDQTTAKKIGPDAEKEIWGEHVLTGLGVRFLFEDGPCDPLFLFIYYSALPPMWLLNWFHLSKEKETIDGAFDRSVCASYKQNKNKPHRHSSPDLNKGGLAAPASPLFVEDRGKKKREARTGKLPGLC